MASQTTTSLPDGLTYCKREENSEGYVTLTRAQVLAFFRAMLADLTTDFAQELQADSELDQISLIHRFHELRTRLTSDEPVWSEEEVREDRRAYDEACDIQAALEAIVGTSWTESLEQIIDKLEEAEEALELDEEDEE